MRGPRPRWASFCRSPPFYHGREPSSGVQLGPCPRSPWSPTGCNHVPKAPPGHCAATCPATALAPRQSKKVCCGISQDESHLSPNQKRFNTLSRLSAPLCPFAHPTWQTPFISDPSSRASSLEKLLRPDHHRGRGGRPRSPAPNCPPRHLFPGDGRCSAGGTLRPAGSRQRWHRPLRSTGTRPPSSPAFASVNSLPRETDISNAIH